LLTGFKRRLRGYDVVTAQSGQEALDLLPNVFPDIVLLDIGMADMDGYEVCRKIRQDPKHCFVKIVFISGRIELADRLKGYQAGADDFLCKPFEYEELMAKLRVLERLQKAEMVDRMKADFLALASHETWTPIGIIENACDVLLSADDMDRSTRRRMIEAISDATEWIAHQAEVTILACKLRAGYELNLDLVSASWLSSFCVNGLQGRLDERNLKVDQAVEDLTLHIDQALMIRAITYVLENAIEHTPDGGTITITAIEEDNACVLSVADQGDGISEEDRGRIFEAFSTSRDIIHHHKGLGLSLTLARHISELHGGSIELVNSDENGSTFAFILPLG
jgi:signal transduction histidine kinase